MHTLRPVVVQGLIIPADPHRPVEIRELGLTAAALSDAIGGGLLDDTRHHHTGTDYVVYLDDDRITRTLPLNDRAAVLSARLDSTDRTWLAELRGDALFLGTDSHHNDTDLPDTVREAARATGLLPTTLPVVAAPLRSRRRSTRRSRQQP